MNEPTIPLSLKLLMGRFMFDGAAPEIVSERFSVSIEDVNHAWFECRELLSAHFARAEDREYGFSPTMIARSSIDCVEEYSAGSLSWDPLDHLPLHWQHGTDHRVDPVE